MDVDACERAREAPPAEAETLAWTLDMADFGCEAAADDAGARAAARPAGPRQPTDYMPDERCLSGEALEAHVAEARAWFKSIGAPRLWVAPLVGYSDASFRQLARECGANIAHTQMLDSGGWVCSPSYRALHDLESDEGPLIVQLGGSRAAQLAGAAEMLAALPSVAGVELNLGCPQRCARQAGFGAFLAEDVDNLRECVHAMLSLIHI